MKLSKLYPIYVHIGSIFGSTLVTRFRGFREKMHGMSPLSVSLEENHLYIYIYTQCKRRAQDHMCMPSMDSN